MSKQSLTIEQLRSELSYDPATGIFLWIAPRDKWFAGKAAGWIDRHGHRNIELRGTRFMAHRLAWFYVHGVWPTNEIDHKNMICDDNRIENLREATKAQNRANQRVRRDSSSGLKGVRQTRNGRWQARIVSEGKTHYLGVYADPKEAHSAYAMAAQKLFGQYARAA